MGTYSRKTMRPQNLLSQRPLCPRLTTLQKIQPYDQYLTAEVLLPRSGESHRGTVRRRSKDEDGKPIGKRASNPILDTRQYEVEFLDGSIDTYIANLIAENLYSQVDDKGRQYQLIDEIMDHRKDGSTLATDDGTYMDRSGKAQPSPNRQHGDGRYWFPGKTEHLTG
jgi:hypothetical protein